MDEFYLLDVTDMQRSQELFLATKERVTKDEARELVHQHLRFNRGNDKLLYGKTLEEAIKVHLEDEPGFGGHHTEGHEPGRSYHVDIYHKGKITDEEIKVLEKFTNKKVNRLE